MSNTIKPQELRIGNILNYLSPEDGVLSTVIDWQDIKWCTERNEDFNKYHKPIELTEEILVKCGFVSEERKSNINGKEFTMFLDYGRVRLSGIGAFTYEKTGKLYITVYCKGNYITNNLEFLHELQNAYYFLTSGRELEIKL